ncbi:fimbrial outer membrane usher protein [Enterobacter hormaechei]|uniref:FimD/PapC N-terminal domain-containing protein n=1 Tax=Enterobacter hormaechei TaxID=158836 RepID=UPI000794E880|nr:FimD/PapC N-terminal domain-containing protein [Enterobacter hormaechei]SAI27026.1 fimbrial outer membrane usher protein [Enterobacter hormaechei]
MLFQRSLLCLAICAALPLHASENGKNNVDTASESESAIEFNDQFLIANGGSINVERYAYGNPVLPGTYRVKVNLNGNSKSTVEMTFIDNKTPRASACLTKLILSQSGIDTSKLGDDIKKDEAACVDIKKYYPGASESFG